MPDTPDSELLARPGCIRATWWSRCRGCGRRISEGEIVILGTRDGHRSWLCRTCGQETP